VLQAVAVREAMPAHQLVLEVALRQEREAVAEQLRERGVPQARVQEPQGQRAPQAIVLRVRCCVTISKATRRLLT